MPSGIYVRTEKIKEILKRSQLKKWENLKYKEMMISARTGLKRSNEAKTNMSKAQKGLKHKPMSEETKKKLRLALKGHVAWNKGLTKETDKKILMQSESLKNTLSIQENKIKMSKIAKEIWQRDGYKKHMSEVHKGQSHPMSEETKKKLSKALKGRCLSQKHIKALCKGQIERFKNSVIWNKGLTKDNSEGLMKLSKSMEKTWSNLEAKARHKKIINEPKHKEKVREAVIKRWQNPDFRKRQIKVIRKMWSNPIFIKHWIEGRKTKPNSLEKFFNNLTPNYIEYAKDYFVVCKERTHLPDFKVKGQKKVIELFGDYWHKGENPNELIQEYNNVNYQCLIFWEHEVYNDSEEVLKQTLRFAQNYNGNSIQEIEEDK